MLTAGDILGLWHDNRLDYSLTERRQSGVRVIVRKLRYDERRSSTVLVDVRSNTLLGALDAAHAAFLAARDDGTLWEQ